MTRLHHRITAFYVGTLSSSIGSMTFTVSLIAFLAIKGYDLAVIGILVGLSRVLPLIAVLCWGHVVDRLCPRRFLVQSELAAAFTGVGILLAWMGGESKFLLFSGLVIFRACIVAFQKGAQTKVSKGFAEQEKGTQHKHAVAVNVAMTGSTLFAGILSWAAVGHVPFEIVIAFDSATFLLNGIICAQTVPRFSRQDSSVREPIFKKFGFLFQFARLPAVLDLLLAVSMTGLGSFSARLAGENATSIPIQMAIFGAAFWITGWLHKMNQVKHFETSIWALMVVSFLVLATVPGGGLAMYATILLRDCCYAFLFMRYASKVQEATSFEFTASTTSAKIFLGTVVLGLGEFAASLGFNASIAVECYIRGTVCVAGIAAIHFFGQPWRERCFDKLKSTT